MSNKLSTLKVKMVTNFQRGTENFITKNEFIQV